MSSGSRESSRGRDLVRQTEGLGLPALELVRVDFPVVEQALQIPQRVCVEGAGAHQRGCDGRVRGLRRPRVGHIATWESAWIQILNFGPCRSQAVPLLSEGRRGRLVSSKKPAAGFLPVGCSGGLERATRRLPGLC